MSLENGCVNKECQAELDEMFYPKCNHCELCGMPVKTENNGFMAEKYNMDGTRHECKGKLPSWWPVWVRKRARLLYETYGPQFAVLKKGKEEMHLPVTNSYVKTLERQGWVRVAQYGWGVKEALNSTRAR